MPDMEEIYGLDHADARATVGADCDELADYADLFEELGL